MYFFVGLIIGFLVAFFVLKRQISKDGAGNLKCCQRCPYFIKSETEVGANDGT